MKVIGIIKNDPITGVQYGLVEKVETPKDLKHAKAADDMRRQRQMQQAMIRTSRTQHK